LIGKRPDPWDFILKIGKGFFQPASARFSSSGKSGRFPIKMNAPLKVL
jgi:hypothetical protein